MKTVLTVLSSAILALPPITNRLIEYSPVKVKIPVKRAGIFSLVCSNPETKPANAPPSAPNSVAITGDIPFTSALAVIAAPSGKLPSAVISAISKF